MNENRDYDWVDRLQEEFRWVDSEPGPEQVVKEAKKRNIESIGHLIDRMEDANQVPENISETVKERLPESQTEDVLEDLGGGRNTTGYMRWKWYRNYRDAFVGGPCQEK